MAPKARILAVDDQRYFRELVEGILRDEGFEVQTASSGEEALHILEREDFDVVVTDLVMPGIGGPELVYKIRERLPDQDIVAVSGVVDVTTALRDAVEPSGMGLRFLDPEESSVQTLVGQWNQYATRQLRGRLRR